MKTGIELIAEERREQIEKHYRTIENDIQINKNCELCWAASLLLYTDDQASPIDIIGPSRLSNWDQKILNHINEKNYKERLIVAGALIAAEIDRLLNDSGQIADDGL